jgi:hypothetical protein
MHNHPGEPGMQNANHVSRTARQLGSHYGLCSITNPSSMSPPFWSDLCEPVELRRRIHVLLGCQNDSLHGDIRMHFIKQWAQEHGYL